MGGIGIDLLIPLGLGALIALPVVILLHMRNTTPDRRPVPTLRFWLAVAQEQTERTRFRRPPLTALLLLQLLIVAAIAFALTRPVTADAWAELGLRTEPKHVIIMLDGSTSMGATDTASGRSRFEEARELALERVQDLREGDVATILLLGTRVTSFEATDTSQFPQLRARIGRLNPPGGRADLDAAFGLAKDLLLPKLEDKVVLITDGALTVSPDAVAALGAPVELLRIGGDGVGLAGGNIAITALDARTVPGSADREHLFVRIENFSTEQVTAPLVLQTDGIEAARRDETIPPNGATLDVDWGILPTGTAEVTVELQVSDAFVGDNRASLILRQESNLGLRILLVSDIPGPLQRALEVLTGAQVTIEASDSPAVQNVDPSYDLVVYENTAPPDNALPDAAILFVHPAVDTRYFPTNGSMPAPTAANIQANDPLLEGVNLSGVTFGETPSYDLSNLRPWNVAVAGDNNAPLIARGQVEGRSAVLLAFDASGSNIVQRPAFPILIANIASQLVPSPLPISVPLGDPLIYRPSPGAAAVRVTAPDQAPVDLKMAPVEGAATANDRLREVSFVDTGRPGEYTLEEVGADGAAIASGRFVVNAGHPTESNLTVNVDLPSLLAGAQGADQGVSRSSLFDLWPAIVAAAFGLLALEWLVTVLPRGGRKRRLAPATASPGPSSGRRRSTT